MMQLILRRYWKRGEFFAKQLFMMAFTVLNIPANLEELKRHAELLKQRS